MMCHATLRYGSCVGIFQFGWQLLCFQRLRMKLLSTRQPVVADRVKLDGTSRTPWKSKVKVRSCICLCCYIGLHLQKYTFWSKRPGLIAPSLRPTCPKLCCRVWKEEDLFSEWILCMYSHPLLNRKSTPPREQGRLLSPSEFCENMFCIKIHLFQSVNSNTTNINIIYQLVVGSSQLQSTPNHPN